MSPEAFRAFARLSPDACLLVTGEGCVLAANAAAERLTGLGRAEFEGADLFELASDDPADLRQYLRSASRTRGVVTGALTLRTKSGLACRVLGGALTPPAPSRPAHLLLRLEPRASATSRFRLLNEQIERLGAEIRRRHRAEREKEELLEKEQRSREELERSARALRETTARLEAVTASSPLATVAIDHEGRVRFWNPAAERLFGWTADEVTGERLPTLPESRVQEFQDLRERALEGDPPFEIETERRRKDGSMISVALSGAPIRSDTGDVLGTMATFMDITDRKRAELHQRLMAQAGRILASSLDFEETLRQVTDLAVPDFADCALAEVEEEEERYTSSAHATPELDALAEDLHLCFPSGARPAIGLGAVLTADEPQLVPQVTEALLGQVAENEEHLRILRELDPGSLIAVPMRARARRVGTLTFLTTGTRRYRPDDLAFAKELAGRAALALENARLYRAAREASRARDEMVAILSHDLRAPLNVIAGGASLLLDLPLSPEKREDQLRAIARAAARMKRLTGDLLDITRIEGGRLAIEPGSEEAASLAEEALAAYEHTASRKDVTLVTQVEEDLPPVRADRSRALQILENLLDNAIRYTPAGRRVEVGAKASPEGIRFHVADAGPGIPEDERPHLFDRFWQAEERARAGAGLGLAISKGIVDAHGGRIWVESEAGKGTTFYFILPSTQRMRAASS